LGKISGAAAVTRSHVEVTDDGKIKVSAALKAVGILGVWISGFQSPNASCLSVTLHQKLVKQANLKISEVAGENKEGTMKDQILEVDVHQEWSDLGLWEQGYDEVEVVIQLT
jgi:hypothetical protein